MRCALAAFLGLLTLPSLAAAQCNASLEPGPSSISFNGVAIGPGRWSEQAAAVTVRNSGDEPCSLVLRATRELAGIDPYRPPYSLMGPAGEIEILPYAETTGTTRSDVAVNVAPQATRTVPLSFKMPTAWGLRAGFYQDQLRLVLIGENGQEVDSRSVSLRFDIPSTATLRLFGAGVGRGASNIDLGRLSATQETRSNPFALRIWSTAPYAVSFRSDNAGDLVHSNGVDRIPYELRINSVQADLAGGGEYFFASHTGPPGDIHSLMLRVGPVRALAGDYSDRITITVTAR